MLRVHVDLVSDELDVSQVLREVRDDTRGGVVLFLGDVRGVTDGKTTERLEYEAHSAMALKSMGEIGNGAAAEFNANVAIVHRLGPVPVGETSVVCAAACVHRADAFACCRKLIDRLKSETAIWKKEFGPDGAEWVEN